MIAESDSSKMTVNRIVFKDETLHQKIVLDLFVA